MLRPICMLSYFQKVQEYAQTYLHAVILLEGTEGVCSDLSACCHPSMLRPVCMLSYFQKVQKEYALTCLHAVILLEEGTEGVCSDLSACCHTSRRYRRSMLRPVCMLSYFQKVQKEYAQTCLHAVILLEGTEGVYSDLSACCHTSRRYRRSMLRPVCMLSYFQKVQKEYAQTYLHTVILLEGTEGVCSDLSAYCHTSRRYRRSMLRPICILSYFQKVQKEYAQTYLYTVILLEGTEGVCSDLSAYCHTSRRYRRSMLRPICILSYFQKVQKEYAQTCLHAVILLEGTERVCSDLSAYCHTSRRYRRSMFRPICTLLRTFSTVII